jgi:hypothetical protein
MTLNHTIVPVRDKLASAKFLAKDSELSFTKEGRGVRIARPSRLSPCLCVGGNSGHSMRRRAAHDLHQRPKLV